MTFSGCGGEAHSGDILKASGDALVGFKVPGLNFKSLILRPKFFSFDSKSLILGPRSLLLASKSLIFRAPNL